MLHRVEKMEYGDPKTEILKLKLCSNSYALQILTFTFTHHTCKCDLMMQHETEVSHY